MAKVIIPQSLVDQGYVSVRDAAIKLGATKHYIKRYIEAAGIETVELPKGTNGFFVVKQSDLSGYLEWAKDNADSKGRGRPESTGAVSPGSFSRKYGIPKDDLDTLIEAGSLRVVVKEGETLIPYDDRNREAVRSYKGDQIDCEALRRLRKIKMNLEKPREETDEEEGHDILLDMCSEYGLREEAQRIMSEDPSLERTLVYLIGKSPTNNEISAVKDLDSLLDQLKQKGNGYVEDFLQRLKNLKKSKSRSAHIGLIQETIEQLVEPEIEDEI